MGGEAVVSSIVSKLSNLLIKEARLLHGVHDEFEWIQRELESMRCFLKDADAKKKEDARARNWVANIRDVSYDAEDVMEAYIFKIVAQARKHGFAGCIKWYSCIFSELKARHKISKEIQRIKLRSNEISRNRETYGIRDINEGGGQEGFSSSQRLQEHRRYFALLEESEIVGHQEDRRTLRERLINGRPRRAVISIVGMGGSGKTTLAKKAYHEVKQEFDCHVFIYLSQQYRIRDILGFIINSLSVLSEEKIQKLTEEAMGKKLSDYLSEKRYLVVIDDIWEEEAWKKLNLVLPDRSNKSRVMLTTRKRDVASYADPSTDPHDMHLLNDDESWELFLKKVFLVEPICPANLEETGRQIVAKCGGLPLAVVVLGGLLSTKDKTLDAWSKVLGSVPWHLAESPDKCMEILALSYYDLPHYLKPCFLYLGLFSEDYEIQSKKLIRLWIAEGFIQQRGNEVLEDVAEDYLEELIGRSMIQSASKKSNGSVRPCRVHDLLRDLFKSEAEENNFFEIIANRDAMSFITKKCRHLAFYCDTDKFDKTLWRSTTAVRSVLCFNSIDLSGLLNNEGGKLLRVLEATDGHSLKNVSSEEMKQFVHLRYLSTDEDEIEISPSLVANAENLQTLEFSIHNYGEFSSAIENLEQLRHLRAYGWEIKDQVTLNNLKNMQTLCLRAGSWIRDGLDKLTVLENWE